MGLTTEDTMFGLVAEHLAVPIEKVTRGANLVDDLGADSIDRVEVAMAVEDCFDLTIGDDESDACATVGDWIDLIEARLAK